jgi:hypothetical protein
MCFMQGLSEEENQPAAEGLSPEEVEQKTDGLYGFIFDHFPSFEKTVAA